MFKKKTGKAKRITSKKQLRAFEEKRMRDFKEGKMHSRKKGTGPLVTKKSQAVAIMLSEARKKGAKIPKKKK